MEKKKILNISIDANLFEEGSEVSKRFIEYASLFERFDAIVYTKPGYVMKELAPNVRVYPTNTAFKPRFFKDAFAIAKKIITPGTIISSQEAMTNLVAVKLKKSFSITFQAQIHTDFMSPFFRKESLKNYFRYRMYLKTIPQADYVRVVSKKILNSIQPFITCSPQHVKVLPIFVDKDRLEKEAVIVDLRKKYPQFTFILLMASRFEVEKNIYLALAAFKEVLKKYPRTGLVLVGKGRELVQIQRYIVRLGLQKNVVIEEWTMSLASYYKTSHAFLSSSNYEGYGLTLVEAALLRVPVVTTNVGIASDLFENGKDALMCEPEDRECFAEQLTKLIEDTVLRRVLTINAEAKVRASLMSKEDYLKAYQEMFI